VRVLEAVGRLAEEGLERVEQGGLGLDVVAVVRGQHLDLVEADGRTVAWTARATGTGDSAPGGDENEEHGEGGDPR
jgi:hypothetical protein